MYDSRYNGGNLESSLTHQLALVYRYLITATEDGEAVDPHLTVHIPSVQQQMGSSDCGVLPLSFNTYCTW